MRTDYVACHRNGRDYWLCRNCGQSFPIKPGIPHCYPPPRDYSDRLLIAASVGIFSVIIVVLWVFAIWMGWV